jgi:uncharacterized delta-60 repeat protein
MRGASASLAALALMIAAALAPGTALARPGALDRSFGDNGRVVTRTSLGGAGWLNARLDLAEGPDGTIVAAAGDSVFRYLPDGALDPTFGEAGRTTIATEFEGMPFSLHAVAVDSQGRIYALGEVEIADVKAPTSYMGAWIHPPLAAVARYTADGRLDTSYASGKGYLLTDLGQPATYGSAVSYRSALTSLAAGRIDTADNLVATASIGGFPCSVGHSELSMFRRLIVRLTPDGGLDPSFGGGSGTETIAALDAIGATALSTAGEIAFAGRRATNCGKDTVYRLGRLSADGALDPRFGREGLRPLPAEAVAISLDRFGRTIVLLPGRRLLRLTPAGRADRRFGRKGHAYLSLPGANPNSVIVEPSGRILLTGGSFPHSFAVTRLNGRGYPDRHFGRRGLATTGFGKYVGALAKAAFIDRHGRLVVGGTMAESDTSHIGGIALARYRLGR